MHTYTRPSVIFSVTRFTVVASGRCALNALAAWVTSAVRSARNSTRLTQLASISCLTRAMTVRVFPDPVAITNRASRCLAVNASSIARIARC